MTFRVSKFYVYVNSASKMRTNTCTDISSFRWVTSQNITAEWVGNNFQITDEKLEREKLYDLSKMTYGENNRTQIPWFINQY